MQRWRLRFNLQEIDLQPGKTTLGRAAECPISLDDALVSRHHAEIHVGETGCMILDLGSRNGVRVNGVRLNGPKVLLPNDRIRLGRDELVLLLIGGGALEPGGKPTRPTAAHISCEQCGHEHVADLSACPQCGRVPVIPGKASAPAQA